MKLADQRRYIFSEYNKDIYDDLVMNYFIGDVCVNILDWMQEKIEFDDVMYVGGIEYTGEKFQIENKDIKDIVNKLLFDESISIQYRYKETLEEGLRFLLRDMYHKDDSFLDKGRGKRKGKIKLSKKMDRFKYKI